MIAVKEKFASLNLVPKRKRMKTTYEPKTLDSGIVEPAHTIEVVCQNCGFDLDESELAADTCSDCGEILNINRVYLSKQQHYLQCSGKVCSE